MRQGKAWSPEEVRALSQAFREGATIQDLALRHERTDRAIRVRLERVGLLSPDSSSNKGAADATPAPSAGPEPLSRITKTPEKHASAKRPRTSAWTEIDSTAKCDPTSAKSQSAIGASLSTEWSWTPGQMHTVNATAVPPV